MDGTFSISVMKWSSNISSIVMRMRAPDGPCFMLAAHYLVFGESF